jgi:hypothetical protein
MSPHFAFLGGGTSTLNVTLHDMTVDPHRTSEEPYVDDSYVSRR